MASGAGSPQARPPLEEEPCKEGRKPSWIRTAPPSGSGWLRVSGTLRELGLATVCDSARCPNKAECWGASTATFMVLGGTCTRACRFCAVDRGRAGEPLEPDEPERLARAVSELGIEYAVITSVDRDDLPDRGAAHFAACVRAVKDANPLSRVELLAPDYREGEIEMILDAGPDVVAHNVETVERLQGLRDARASYAASLHTLSLVASREGGPLAKSSLMLGLGEGRGEVLRTMEDLRRAGCESLVLGQYLRPSPAQVEVAEYLRPEDFDRYAEEARALGFRAVVSAPLARTSYHARGGFEESAGTGE
jgi:lipoyl synthase